jgi:hypothetical protein
MEGGGGGGGLYQAVYECWWSVAKVDIEAITWYYIYVLHLV